MSNETPSWKGIEGRTGGPGWGAFGPGKDQEIIVSFNKNTTPCSSNYHGMERRVTPNFCVGSKITWLAKTLHLFRKVAIFGFVIALKIDKFRKVVQS